MDQDKTIDRSPSNMKKSLIASALMITLTNVGIADEPAKSPPKSKSAYKLSITHEASDLMTDEEKEKYYNASMDNLFVAIGYEQFDKFDPMFSEDYQPGIFDQRPKYEPKLPRFNRSVAEPKLPPLELEKRVLYLQSLLDKAIIPLMGENLTEGRRRLLTLNGPYDFIETGIELGVNYRLNIQPNYLMPRVVFLTENLYSSEYNISDFEYTREKRTSFSALEKEYEIIYLNIKSAGLLRKMPGAYYPKSFLREHADQTGLTQYIQTEESKSNTRLEHDVLAEQFFGSYDKWIHSFYEFLDNKIIQLNIGK